MPIEFPTYDQIVERTRADIASELPEVDPTISGSFVSALAISNAGRHYDNVLLIQQLLKELFPQTATGEFLEMWAQYEGLYRLAATPSTGNITVTGTAGTSIPIDTQWRTVENMIVKSLAAATIAAVSQSVTLNASGSTVTATTSSDHSLATGMIVTISGATDTNYNGSWVITVTDTDEFQYEATPNPSGADSGTLSYDGATVEVESIDTGDNSNLASGTELQLTAPIVGVDNTAFVQFLGLTGGGDEETDEALLERVLTSRSNPVANFNESAIILQAKTVSGVTRVFVNPITPYVGAVTVAFMRDNDTNPIPDAGEVQDVYDALLEILPASSDPAELYVQAPSPVSVDFTFSSITPDTATMRQAIENNLIVYFDEETEYEIDIDEDKYRSIIINTIDTETGDSLLSFNLTTPSTDITISTGEIGVLGTVSF